MPACPESGTAIPPARDGENNTTRSFCKEEGMQKFRWAWLGLLLCGVAYVLMAGPAMAVKVDFHGDMNHRFLLGTNHNDFFQGEHNGKLDDDDVYDNFGEIKYRFWFEAASDDGDYKGVFATEVGGLHFGADDEMDYSGDEVQMEVRWGYFDFQLPFVDQESRMRMGLQPININPFLWKETVGGVTLNGSAGVFDYQLGWLRGYEVNVASEDDEDLLDDQDSFYGRLDYKGVDNFKLGLFALYQMQDTDDSDPNQDYDVTGGDLNYGFTPASYEFKNFGYEEVSADISLATFGLDGSMGFDPFFVNWDVMYQTGSIDHLEYANLNDLNDLRFGDKEFNELDLEHKDYDVSAYFAHLDLGMNWNKHTFTYTFWYTSGDDDPDDDDLDAFMATDIDRADSIVLMEGSYADDDYFTERHYILDRGFIMNKLGWDYQVNEKLQVGLAGMYMMTSEDVEYKSKLTGENVSEDELGMEVDGYVKYQLFENVELAWNAGYLAAGDAMDYFEREQDGDSDEDIWRSDMRIRYTF
jgi:hypothetical protein